MLASEEWTPTQVKAFRITVNRSVPGRSGTPLAKRKQGALSAAEITESQNLDTNLTAANTVVNRFLAEEERAFAPGTALAKEVVDLKQAESVQRSLQKLGPKAVATYTLEVLAKLPDRADDWYLRLCGTARIGRQDWLPHNSQYRVLQVPLFRMRGRRLRAGEGAHPTKCCQPCVSLEHVTDAHVTDEHVT